MTNYFKQDDKTVALGTLWLRWQFYFQYDWEYDMIIWLSDFLLIYNNNFILRTDRAGVSFKCYVKEKWKCSFENAHVEKSESSTDLK